MKLLYISRSYLVTAEQILLSASYAELYYRINIT